MDEITKSSETNELNKTLGGIAIYRNFYPDRRAQTMLPIPLVLLNLAVSHWPLVPTLSHRKPRSSAAVLNVNAQDEKVLTKRQRRRLRATPSSLQEWVKNLNSHEGGLQLWIDLDNAADSLEQLEFSQVK